MSRTPRQIRLLQAVPGPVRLLAAPVVLLVGIVLLVTTAGPWEPPLTAPQPDGRTAGYCRALVGALPDTLQGHPRRTPSPSPYVVVWDSSPRTVLRCGVRRPASLAKLENRLSEGPNVDDIQWYLEQDGHGGARLTTTELAVYVELSVPAGPYAEYPLTAVSQAVRATVPDYNGKPVAASDG